MTSITTDGSATVKVIVGAPDQVAAALRRAHADGRLLTIAEVCALPGQRVRLTAVLLEPPPTPGRSQRLRPALTIVAGLIGVAALVSLAWLVLVATTTLITTAISWLGSHWPIIGLVTAVVCVLSSRRR
jgi:hypothetical protein